MWIKPIFFVLHGRNVSLPPPPVRAGQLWARLLLRPRRLYVVLSEERRGSLRRTSCARIRLFQFFLPLCLFLFLHHRWFYLWNASMFLFLIKGRKKSSLVYNRSDDSIGLLSAKWLPVIASVTVFLPEAGFWAQGETAPQDAPCPSGSLLTQSRLSDTSLVMNSGQLTLCCANLADLWE